MESPDDQHSDSGAGSDRNAGAIPRRRCSPVEIEEDTRAPEPPDEPSEEFEIVLGRRQVASVSFVAIVIVVIFSSFSYLAGEMASPKKKAAPAAAAQAPTPVATQLPQSNPILCCKPISPQKLRPNPKRLCSPTRRLARCICKWERSKKGSA